MRVDDIFTAQTTDVQSLSGLDETQIKIVMFDDVELNTANIMTDGYYILLNKSTYHNSDDCSEKFQKRLYDILIDYSGYIDFYKYVFVQKAKLGNAMPYTRFETYSIYLNPNKNIKMLLNLLIAIDNIGDIVGASNRLEIHTTEYANINYGFFASQITPNGEFIRYLQAFKYSELPVTFSSESERYEETIKVMRTIIEASALNMVEAYNYDKKYVLEEVRKWLRTSKQHWSLSQIENHFLDYNEYEDRACKNFQWI